MASCLEKFEIIFFFFGFGFLGFLLQIVQYRWNPFSWINLGFLGIIHKRLVEFRLDFLALIRIDQILTSPSLVDIPPVFVFVQSLRQALLILVLLVTENGHRVFLWVPQQFLMPAAPCIVRRWVV